MGLLFITKIREVHTGTVPRIFHYIREGAEKVFHRVAWIAYHLTILAFSMGFGALKVACRWIPSVYRRLKGYALFYTRKIFYVGKAIWNEKLVKRIVLRYQDFHKHR